ncbi:MAG: ferrochelatase [Actinomycetota bacterium]|nr:ferrochelatase [Actinomycetota bacterium]
MSDHVTTNDNATPNDTRIAVLLMAYGTPRTRDEIEPYYTDIRRGRAPTPEQLADLTARYEALGGTSPLAARTEAQRDALQAALDAAAPGRYHVALGLKHAEPKIEGAVDELAAQGFRHIVGLVLAPHFSSFSIGQYLDRARAAAEPHGITITGIESWATEPAFVEFIAADLRSKLAAMPANTKVLFTAHSLPQRIIDAGDPYPTELRATAEAVAAAVGLGQWSNWAIAWQSAGRTPEPWLGPDILQVIDELADAEHDAGGPRGVVVSAVGFVADHLEVLYDLDIEAAARAAQHGLAFARTACVNADASVMAALAQRVIEAG